MSRGLGDVYKRQEEDIEELKENCRNREDEVLVNKFIELWRN